jgi:hypothetical protein
MEKRLLDQIERETSGVIPIKERATRITELEAELERLSFAEEVLIAAAIADGDSVQRSRPATWRCPHSAEGDMLNERSGFDPNRSWP